MTSRLPSHTTLWLLLVIATAPLPLAGQSFEVLHVFDRGTEGIQPYGELIQGSDGRLYGTTISGGNYDGGTVFAVNPDGSEHVVLHHFDLQTAYQAIGGVIEGTDGRLYGASSAGSGGNWGSVYALNRDGSGFTILHEFWSSEGAQPMASLLEGTDGRLYGTGLSGGSLGHGVIFAIERDGSGYQIIHRFMGAADGSAPRCTLLQAADGRLYGTASAGGANGAGTLYSLSLDGSDFHVLRHLNEASDGSTPHAGLIQGADGRLYGVNRNGGGGTTGPSSYGTVFALDVDPLVPEASAFVVLTTFDNTIGHDVWPEGRLVQADDGRLIGTTSFQSDCTIFSVRPDGTGYSDLRVLPRTEGAFLRAGLLKANDGRLYGTAAGGGKYDLGSVYRLSQDGSGFSVLHHLDYRNRGRFPQGPLLELDGRLYGTTSGGAYDPEPLPYPGSAHQFGTLFSIQRDGTGLAILRNLTSAVWDDLLRGNLQPNGGLVVGEAGRLFGSTSSGGEYGRGGIFALEPDGSGHTVVHSFGLYPDAQLAPSAELVKGPDGRLYGISSDGDSRIFALDADGTGYSILHTLAGDGSEGISSIYNDIHLGLLAGSDGRLYGVTGAGGANLAGTVFRLDPATNAFEVIHHFDPGTDGYFPYGGLIEGRDGRLYGTNSEPVGTVYRLHKDGSDFTVLYTFANSEATGTTPTSSVVEGPDGRLYGVTAQGGTHGAGTVYSVARDGSEFTVLHQFDPSADGYAWGTRLSAGTDGSIYGVMQSGGRYSSSGLLFALRLLPEITSPASADGVYGEPFEYLATASNAPTEFDALDLPPGLAIDHATGLISGVPSLAGSFAATLAAFNDAGIGTAELEIVIGKAAAAVFLSDLVHDFDGSPKAATVQTEPAGLPTVVTYNGAAQPPSAPGSYVVLATVQDANHAGAASDTLVIRTPAAAADVSASIEVLRGGFRLNRATRRYVQTVTLKNVGPAVLSGPVSLVLDQLSANASLASSSGVTAAVAPLGSPYLNAVLGGNNVLGIGDTTTLLLEFSNSNNQPITYETRVLAGPGNR